MQQTDVILREARDMGRAVITAIWHDEGSLAFQVASGADESQRMAMIAWLAGQVVGLTRIVLAERGYEGDEVDERFRLLMTEIDNKEFLE